MVPPGGARSSLMISPERGFLFPSGFEFILNVSIYFFLFQDEAPQNRINASPQCEHRRRGRHKAAPFTLRRSKVKHEDDVFSDEDDRAGDA